MGYLIDAWQQSQKKFDMSLKAIVNIAGDESLEKPEAVKEMRQFFGMIDIPTMERLMHECYSNDKKLKFDSRGFAFQDLVNEMGRRLGYEVENGLYRGKKNEVGFDGVWKSQDGFIIIMESKATGAYAFSPETVIGYRDKLINELGIPKKKCSILVVYGRDEKKTLRNAVKGSDESQNIRLISANALFQLVKLMTVAGSETGIKQINTLLRPQDYYVLDNLVELVFPQTDDEIEAVEDNDDESEKADENVTKVQVKGAGQKPPLPDGELKVGAFVKSSMTALSESGYTFTDEGMELLLGSTSMHDVVGLSRKLPFFKLFDPDDPKGHYINGVTRFYAKPLVFGKYTVYLTKELFESDREPFIIWYDSL